MAKAQIDGLSIGYEVSLVIVDATEMSISPAITTNVSPNAIRPR